MGGGEEESILDSRCIEERKGQIWGFVEIRGTYEVLIVGNVAGRVWGGIMDVEVPKDKCWKVELGE